MVRVALGRSTHSKLAELAEQASLKHRHPHAAVGVLGRTAVVDLARDRAAAITGTAAQSRASAKDRRSSSPE
jgi:hypothetical protein